MLDHPRPHTKSGVCDAVICHWQDVESFGLDWFRADFARAKGAFVHTYQRLFDEA